MVIWQLTSVIPPESLFPASIRFTNILSHTEAGESPAYSLLHFGKPPPISLYPSVCKQNSFQLIVKYLNLKYTIQNVYIRLNIKESTLRVSAEGHLVNVYWRREGV